jgi:hypothetical protein
MVDAEMPVIQSSQLYLDWDAIGWEDWRWGANTKRDPKGIYWERPGINMGVEAAVWSERIDPSNLECRVWPRTSALAEDAWAGLATLKTHMGQHKEEEEAKRTALMIERMGLLGISAFAGKNKERACAQLGDDKQRGARPISLVDVIDTAGGKGTSGGGPLPDNAQGFGSP